MTISNPPTSSESNSQKEKKSKYQINLPEEKSLIPIFVIGSILLHLISLLLLGFFGLAIWKLAHRPLPQLVQMSDGSMIAIKPADPLYRDPNSIKNFIGEISYLLYSWSGQIKVSEKGQTKIQSDPGVELGDEEKPMKIPTTTFEASFALSDQNGYRIAYLKQYYKFLSKYVSFSEIWSGQAFVSLKIVFQGEPELIAPGKWKVNQIANLTIIDRRTPAGRAIPLNQEIYIQAINTPPLPLEESASAVQRTMYRIRMTQLEIYDIQVLEK